MSESTKRKKSARWRKHPTTRGSSQLRLDGQTLITVQRDHQGGYFWYGLGRNTCERMQSEQDAKDEAMEYYKQAKATQTASPSWRTEREELRANLLAIFASVRTREQAAEQQHVPSFVPCANSLPEKAESLLAELDGLRAENNRLREKLAEISFAYWDNRDRAYMRSLADEALGGAK